MVALCGKMDACMGMCVQPQWVLVVALGVKIEACMGMCVQPQWVLVVALVLKLMRAWVCVYSPSGC